MPLINAVGELVPVLLGDAVGEPVLVVLVDVVVELSLKLLISDDAEAPPEPG